MNLKVIVSEKNFEKRLEDIIQIDRIIYQNILK